ncbi:MAG: hypothetical protein MSA90_22635 [Faecalicatena sp.]|uniref:hypothetical protein n=1 Tax=Faecalicatena sp. TaxID=2005360 RepID=UPI00258FE0A9|nr:hypothetical protein [Faecalicatena sp.]MCI6468247.1 hypothetical protein [Faecalicatena sp.]MDY5620501.1 hypothetical protein [Lachnospiraceae bacterium]
MNIAILKFSVLESIKDEKRVRKNVYKEKELEYIKKIVPLLNLIQAIGKEKIK